MKIFNLLEWFSLNIVGISVVTWLSSLVGIWSSVMACLVACSILVMNGYKIYGIHLDNQLKRKQLNDN